MNKEDRGEFFQKKMPFPRFAEDQCRRIHEASLEILDRVGVRLDLPEAVDLIKKAGARVDQENLVHLPSRLVEKALASAPKSVVLHDRQGNPAIVLEGYRCFYGPGSDCLNIIDHRSRKRRKALLKDVQEGIVLCDALSNIDFVMSMLLPSDVD
jgi:trimethylamine--corrinoid protein Co-methyltransferase